MPTREQVSLQWCSLERWWRVLRPTPDSRAAVVQSTLCPSISVTLLSTTDAPLPPRAIFISVITCRHIPLWFSPRNHCGSSPPQVQQHPMVSMTTLMMVTLLCPVSPMEYAVSLVWFTGTDLHHRQREKTQWSSLTPLYVIITTWRLHQVVILDGSKETNQATHQKHICDDTSRCPLPLNDIPQGK